MISERSHERCTQQIRSSEFATLLLMEPKNTTILFASFRRGNGERNCIWVTLASSLRSVSASRGVASSFQHKRIKQANARMDRAYSFQDKYGEPATKIRITFLSCSYFHLPTFAGIFLLIAVERLSRSRENEGRAHGAKIKKAGSFFGLVTAHLI